MFLVYLPKYLSIDLLLSKCVSPATIKKRFQFAELDMKTDA